MCDNQHIPDRFRKVTGLDADWEKVLYSIRFQDQDQSTKAGAVLTFSGLLIATSLVQFNAPVSSIVYLAKDFPYLNVSALGLLLLFVASFLSLWNLVVTRFAYSNDVHEALLQFEGLVSVRRTILRISVACCMLGSLMVLIMLFTAIALSNGSAELRLTGLVTAP